MFGRVRRHGLGWTMAFPVEWPSDIGLQLLICAGLLAATVILARIDFLRAVIFFIGGTVLRATRLAAAGVIWLFDKVMPVDGRNGRVRIAKTPTTADNQAFGLMRVPDVEKLARPGERRLRNLGNEGGGLALGARVGRVGVHSLDRQAPRHCGVLWATPLEVARRILGTTA